jgi:hypothetical protein
MSATPRQTEPQCRRCKDFTRSAFRFSHGLGRNLPVTAHVFRLDRLNQNQVFTANLECGIHSRIFADPEYSGELYPFLR